MAQMILGLFDSQENADAAINELQDSGFNPKDISVIMRGGATTADRDLDRDHGVAGGAASGATTGVLIGALAGLLIGVGAIAIPGIGAVLIGGPIAAALGLTGAAATAATGAITGGLAGGLIGALTNLGVPEDRARVYEEKIKSGAILLLVPFKGGDDLQNARHILDNNGASETTTIDTAT